MQSHFSIIYQNKMPLSKYWFSLQKILARTIKTVKLLNVFYSSTTAVRCKENVKPGTFSLKPVF